MKKKIEKKFSGFVWFDIEAFVNEDGFHEANLVMAKRNCIICLNSSKNCDICLLVSEKPLEKCTLGMAIL
jgi:hypothetical protein